MKLFYLTVKHKIQQKPRNFGFQVLFALPILFVFINCYGYSRFEEWKFISTDRGDSLNSRIFHVSKTGIDTNCGNAANPFLTISKAAEYAFPGDIILIEEGVYRESINPPRGGSSETCNITYKAAIGARVIIKGSEIVENWVKEDSGIWKTILHDSLFSDYNPYRTNITGDYLEYGQWHHTGEVYLNEQPLSEKQSIAEVISYAGSWFVESSDTTVSIYANFGKIHPSDALIEINKEEVLFYPATPGKNYITIDSLTFSQSATNWQSPVGEQKAMIGSNGGHHWTIKNCTIIHSRSTGISLGNPSGSVDLSDIEKNGYHVIENNVISHCGEAGICGRLYSSNSRISNNLIEEINQRLEFGGYETAGIKFHASIGIEINNNIVRGINGVANAGPGHGVWIDYGNQGTSISHNIIYNISGCALFFECNSGPFLVHNNIFAGNIQNAGSSNIIFLNNMFIHSNFTFFNSPKRLHWKYGPNSFSRVITDIPSIVSNIRFYNNILFYKGLEFGKFEGLFSESNVFYTPGWENNWGDSLSIYLKEDPKLKYSSFGRSFQLDYYVSNKASRLLQSPLKDANHAGFNIVEEKIRSQGFQLRNIDLTGNYRDSENKVAGPFSSIYKGINHYTVSSNDGLICPELIKNKAFSSEEFEGKLMSVYSKRAKKTYSIGEIVDGGMIYYLESNKKGGGIAYIVALENIGTLPWSDSISAGTKAANTPADQKASEENYYTSAISACNSYTRDGFENWTLPTINELALLFDVAGRVNNSIDENKISNSDPIVIRTSYWSSNEEDSQQAWIFNMGCGTQSAVSKSSLLRVRPVKKVGF